MALFQYNGGCGCRIGCTGVALLVSAVIGVIVAFLQIAGVFTATVVALWVALGIAVVYLAVLAVAVALANRRERAGCLCTGLNAVLLGILGTILFAVILLAVGITATSVVSAVLVGLLTGFFALTITATACFVRCLADCAE